MKFLIMHLSDLHFRESPTQNHILGRVDKIASAAASVSTEASLCLAVVSGDIAFSGVKAQYAVAGDFLTRLRLETSSRLHDVAFHFILVPGNHDCDFSQPDKARELILAGIAEADLLDDRVSSACLHVQEDYLEFASRWASPSRSEALVPGVYWTEDYDVLPARIRFQLLNSALTSSLHEVPGALRFPAQALASAPSKGPPPDLVVTVMHHPYAWFEPTNARTLRVAVEASSDIVLTGHEHEGDYYKKERYTGQRVDFIEGGVLQDSSRDHPSSFTVLVVDTEERTNRLHTFTWQQGTIYADSGEPITVPLQRNASRLRAEYVVKKEFDHYLTNAGVRFTHPEKDPVTLDDVFVYPDLRLTSMPSRVDFSPKIIREEVPQFVFDSARVLLVGPEKCGKTSLAKTLCKDLRRFGLVPVLLLGEKIKRPDEESLRSVLMHAYADQYASPEVDSFNQLEPSQRAIIVDDFDNIKLNAPARDRLLKALGRHSNFVVLIADDKLRYDELLSSTQEESEIWGFTQCEILAFGHLRRYDLIEKWVSLGRAHDLVRAEVSQKTAQTEKVLSQLLGDNFVPPYPLFVLVMLQQMEIRAQVDSATKSGSYGYIYEALLTTALASASKLSVDLDTQYNYLSELGFLLFEKRQNALSLADADQWHRDYCRRYSLRLDFQETLRNFEVATILTGGDSVSFCYPYLYYYFVARHFRDHLDEAKIRNYIASMSARLHHKESANILLFLSYLSKDPFILSSIVQAAETLFPSFPECDFQVHTDFLNTIAKNVPDLIIGAEHPDVRRRLSLEQQDELHADEPDQELDMVVIDSLEEDTQLRQFLQLNVAFKTIQILGQILRNYAGSLRADLKTEIATNAYSLSLRVIKFMFQMIEEGQQELIEVLANIVRTRHPEWSGERLASEVEGMVFNLSEGLAFVVVKHVSDSLGDERLSITFNDILAASTNISYQFIDVSLRLDYYRGFPSNELFKLFKSVRKSPFASQLVRHLAWYHFYLYPVRYDVRESACKRLGIKLQPHAIHDPRPKLLKKP